MSIKRSNCPDCEGELHQVRVSTHTSFGDAHLSYELTNSPSEWEARPPAKGTLLVNACTKCGRVIWSLPHGSEQSDPKSIADSLGDLADEAGV